MGNSCNTFAETKQEKEAEADGKGGQKKAIYFRPAAATRQKGGGGRKRARGVFNTTASQIFVRQKKSRAIMRGRCWPLFATDDSEVFSCCRHKISDLIGSRNQAIDRPVDAALK
jgi:hypothetical protein